MEKESFSDPAIAKLINQNFVAVKVDREERPDIDNLYMEMLTAMTGTGGWPMNLFLTPDRKPFFGGTYFPPDNRGNMPGLRELLTAIAESWKQDKEKLLRSSGRLLELMESVGPMCPVTTEADRTHTEANDWEKLCAAGYEELAAQFDDHHGGFSDAPKFPMGHTLSFLLRFWTRTGTRNALDIAEKTLRAVARGGIHDHLGGGFHRYSTDADWHVPHFEKMLYDQAILARCYLEAYQTTGDPRYAAVAGDTLDYILQDMTDPLGYFYSAEDADSPADISRPDEKSEGAFYLWTVAEIEKNLGKKEAVIFCSFFGVPEKETGPCILHQTGEFEDTARKFGQPASEIKSLLARAAGILLASRNSRLRPHRDDKLLTDWNGLAIASLAMGGRILAKPRYLEAAQKAADFILKTMINGRGRLFHRYRHSEIAIPGFLDDYAFLCYGLLHLYEASSVSAYFAEAKRLAEQMNTLFRDPCGGGLFFAGTGSGLIRRLKESRDGAMPCGNAVASQVFLRLSSLTRDARFEKWGLDNLSAFSKKISMAPSQHTEWLSSLEIALGLQIRNGSQQLGTPRAVSF
jgi:uncharacterized protein YyaL (SSP411 family)